MLTLWTHILWSATLVIVVAILIAVVGFGFRIHLGWDGFEVRVDRQGISPKEVDKRIHRAFRQYMGLLDSYNRDIQRNDQNCRIIITHKLDDVAVPDMYCRNEVDEALLKLNIRYTLLVMNMENHYDDATQSFEKLTNYLRDKYAKLVVVASPFMRESEDAYAVAYEVLTSWWNIVGSAVHERSVGDTQLDTSRIDAVDDMTWKRHIKDDLARHQNTVETIDNYPSIYPAVMSYFNLQHRSFPEFLRS